VVRFTENLQSLMLLHDPKHNNVSTKSMCVCGYVTPLISDIWHWLSSLEKVTGFYNGTERISKNLVMDVTRHSK